MTDSETGTLMARIERDGVMPSDNNKNVNADGGQSFFMLASLMTVLRYDSFTPRSALCSARPDDCPGPVAVAL